MALKVRDAAGATQNLPEWVDATYRAAGTITAAQAAGTGKDLLLFTASSTGVTRLCKAKFTLQGGGTESAALNTFVMLRVVAAPTGQTNVAITATKHDNNDGNPGSTVNITPSTTQTAGTSSTVLGASALGIGIGGTGGTSYLTEVVEFACGPESMQKAIVVPASGFVTWRTVGALPSGSQLAFDIMWTEAAE